MLFNRILRTLPALGAAVLAGGLATVTSRAFTSDGVKPVVKSTGGTLPITNARQSFVENRGQWPSDVLYMAKKSGSVYWVTREGIVMDVFQVVKEGTERYRKGHVFGLHFLNTSEKAYGAGADTRRFHTDFVRPDSPQTSVHGAKAYGSAFVKNIYPGVDLKNYWDGDAPRFDLVVAPGTNPNVIQFEYTSVNSAIVAADGTINLSTSIGGIKTQGLKVYQKVGGVTKEVGAAFTKLPNGKFGFKLAAYDSSKELIIDPLIYGTHIGGDIGDDYANATTADLNGNVYVTGRTGSADFPITQGPYGVNLKDLYDAYLLGLTGDAYDVSYVAYVGGTGPDEGKFVQVDQYGSVWIAGKTNSFRMPVGFTSAVTVQTQNDTSLPGSPKIVPIAGDFNSKFLGTDIVKTPWDTTAPAFQALLNAVNQPGANTTQVTPSPAGWVLPGTPAEAGIKKYFINQFSNAFSGWDSTTFQISSRTRSYVNLTAGTVANGDPQQLEFEPDTAPPAAPVFGFDVHGGTFTLTFTRSDQTGTPVTSAPIKWNATAADVKTALAGMSNIGPDNWGAPPNNVFRTVVTGGPLPYTPIQIRMETGNNTAPWTTPQLPLTINTAGLTSGQYVIPSPADAVFYIRFAPDANTLLNPLAKYVYSVYGDQSRPVELSAFKIRPVSSPTGNVDLYFGGYSQAAIPGMPVAFPAAGGYHGYMASVTFNATTKTLGGFHGTRSKYMGNNVLSAVTGLAIAQDGSVFVTGPVAQGSGANATLGPTSTVFETTNGIFPNGGLLRAGDGFLRKYDPNGALVYSGVIGGSGSELPVDVAVDNLGNAYVLGLTDSFNYPRTVGAYGQSFSGGFPYTVVTKVSPSGNQYLYSTNIRQNGLVHPKSIALDTRGDAYIVGHQSPNIVPPLPYTPSAPNVTGQIAAMNTAFGTSQGFIVVLNSTATGSLFTSALGGNNTGEVINSVYVDNGAGVWLTGDSSFGGEFIYNDPAFRGMVQTIVPVASIIPFVVSDPLGATLTSGGTASPPTFGLGPEFTSSLAWKAAFDAGATGMDGFVAKIGVTQPTLQSITINPGQIAGGLGASATGTVTLRSAAPVGGTVVTLRVSQPSVARFNSVGGPSSIRVTIPAGATTATFDVFSSRVLVPSFCDIRVELDSDYLVTRLNVRPWLDSLALSIDTIAGGNTLQATVTLFQPAPAAGVGVLMSSTSNLISFPGGTSVTIPAGQQTVTVDVKTAGVAANTQVDVAAGVEGISASQLLVLTPATVTTLTFDPFIVNGGESSTGTIQLDGEAVAGSQIVLTQTGRVISFTTPLVLTAGATSATFVATTPAYTGSSTSTTVTAAMNGSTAIGVLNHEGNDIISITLDDVDVPGGTVVTGTITLRQPAAATGFKIPMSWSNPQAGDLDSGDSANPSVITIPAGSASANFVINTKNVAADTVMTIKAHKQGYSARPIDLMVRAPGIANLTIAPSSLDGGGLAVGTVTLSAPAPTGGVNVNLTSDVPAAAQVPATVTVAAGATSATFAITTTPVANNTAVTIEATLGASSMQASMIVRAPSMVSLSFSPNTIKGGTSSTGTLTLSAAAPAGGLTVSVLATGVGAPFVSYPATVTVPAGATSVTFTVNSTQVTRTVTAIFTVTAPNGTTSTANLTMKTSV